MTTFKNTSTKTVAHILATCCDEQTLAGVIDGLLCADAEPALSDGQAKIAERLFDELTTMCPDAVTLAQNRMMPQGQ
jgi:hypothetical protein